MQKVILSTALVLGDGLFRSESISLDQAKAWIVSNRPQNFCGHQTVKVLGVEPAQTREVCKGYDQALCLSAKGRLEFGREYTAEEIMEVGVDFRLITRIE
jgi:hypothetical protein